MKKALILFLILPLLSFGVHKYYISLTEIAYKEKTNSVQMIMNVFMDDIETAINKDYKVNLQLTTKNEFEKTDSLFFNYLNKHFKVKINSKKVNYRFIGKEYDGDIVYFYLEIDNVLNPESIDIENDVLIEHFPEQQNLVKVSLKDQRKSLFLDKKNDKGLLKF
ncbi:DUF6702 family protein [Tenacibaculum ovolyticum]|uniref:DUF6702 family protein n=1 Tax=Tenacibaculum ovolyticum TaxID=104270 RepID=UPI003BA9C5C6